MRAASRRHRLSAVLVAVWLGAGACATAPGDGDASLADEGGTAPGLIAPGAGPGVPLVPDLSPGQRPALATDEAGWWMVMDRTESKLKTAGNLVRDEALNRYVKGIVCRLAGPYCPDIRVYLLRVPYFNASMAPNGVMVVWTGLLLRTRNEAQLAAVLGHELGHYLRRHTLHRWRDAKSTTNALIFFQIGAALGGVPVAGQIASLIAMGSITAFSRDQERESDRMGLRLMAEIGYDPRESAKLWQNLIREDEADEDKKTRFMFFSTHPAPEERSEALKRLAEDALKASPAVETGDERFRNIVLPHRQEYLRDELRLRRFSRFEELLKMLLEDGVDAGELHFFRGELYRLRGKKADGDKEGDTDDQDKALAAYAKALDAGGVPPEIHRSMGLIYLKSGQSEKAWAAFAKYLELSPDADDLEIIKSMMQPMG
ncbi:MAG: M48 family metallopeptidase [Alphaproteobacteria bacterium]|nr:M48 family metallopeptidase [Alphaproteobacteria bacterium]